MVMMRPNKWALLLLLLPHVYFSLSIRPSISISLFTRAATTTTVNLFGDLLALMSQSHMWKMATKRDWENNITSLALFGASCALSLSHMICSILRFQMNGAKNEEAAVEWGRKLNFVAILLRRKGMEGRRRIRDSIPEWEQGSHIRLDMSSKCSKKNVIIYADRIETFRFPSSTYFLFYLQYCLICLPLLNQHLFKNLAL